MKKKTILWLSLISIICSIIGIIVFIAATAAAVGSCSQEQLQAGTCTVSSAGSAGLGIGSLIGILLFIVAGICGLIGWIGALIRSAKMQTWGWFVVVLIFSGLGTLIYALAGPADRPQMAYAQQGYPPQYPQQ